MSNYTFAECLRHTGIKIDEAMEQFYLSFCADPNPAPVLDRAFLDEQLRRFEVDEVQSKRMHEALDEIEADPVLHWFTRFLVHDMCAARHRCDLDDYRAMTPTCMKNADMYSFLLLIACVPRSIARLEKLGVPAYFYREIPFTPMARQFERLKKTGNGTVPDFPWDMNFYTCSIFFLDRFYFIPYRLDEQKAAYNNYSGSPINPFYSGDEEKLHTTLGCGLKVVMNHNFVISVEMAKALDKRDGEKMWNNIGFNFLF